MLLRDYIHQLRTNVLKVEEQKIIIENNSDNAKKGLKQIKKRLKDKEVVCLPTHKSECLLKTQEIILKVC